MYPSPFSQCKWGARMQRRHELSDEQFQKIEQFLPGRPEHVGVTAKDNRIFINGWNNC